MIDRVTVPSLAKQILRPFQDFMDKSASGGIFLLICAVTALVWANSPWASSYADLWQTRVSFGLGSFVLAKPLLMWINDGLMAIFFVVVGLEIKREVLIGASVIGETGRASYRRRAGRNGGAGWDLFHPEQGYGHRRRLGHNQAVKRLASQKKRKQRGLTLIKRIWLFLWRSSFLLRHRVKWNMLRMNAALGSLLVALVILLPVQAAQQGKTEPPKITRKANASLQASAISRVEALYPPTALAERVFGAVLVEVAIDESGTVTSARAISGHTLLRQAALDAARSWTFLPTMLQGKPVKVIGTLTFTFQLPEYILREKAIERLKQQIARNPQDPKLHYRLGLAYEDNEQSGDALKSYARAVALKPQYGDALIALAALNVKLNQYDDALRAYNKAVVLDLTPEIKAALYRGIALIYLRRDKFQEAVEPFKRAIALAPQASMYLNLGLTYLKLGDKTSAMEQYRLLRRWNSILAEQLLKQINEAQ